MERGGTTTQSGILYQNSITALYLGELIDGRERAARDTVVSVRVEAPEHVDDTVVTYADDRRVYIQAKENIQKSETAWAELWRDFRKQFESDSFVHGRDRLLAAFGTSRDDYHALKEICQRAAYSVDAIEFRGRLTEGQTALLQLIENILFAPKPPEAEPDDEDDKPKKKVKRAKAVPHVSTTEQQQLLLELLKHLDVDIRTPRDMDASIRLYIPESDRTQRELFVRFRDRAGELARVRGSFDADMLLAELAADGIHLAKQLSLAELRAKAKESGAELKAYKKTFGRTGVHVERPIAQEIVNWVSSSPADRRVAVLLDAAGSGKTVVAQDVLELLEAEGVPVLTLKADILSGIKDLEDLQERLGLTENISRVLDRLAGEGRAVLLVDQIDALSLSLAHDMSALDAALRLVALAQGQPKVRIIISCRTFDLKNDPKLSRMEYSQEFNIHPLTDDEVKLVLDGLDVDPHSLTPALQTLLRTPLHLDLFARIVGELRLSSPDLISARLGGVKSLQELYAALWEYVILKVEANAPSFAVREKVLSIITEEMNERQQVSISRSVIMKRDVPQLDAAVSWLASHGIISINKDRLTLLHQTFFDYCYAKNFVEKGGSLFETVKAGEQGLFVRSQVVQVLAYYRDAGEPNYIVDLNSLLTSDEIRFHLRDHVMRWFGSLSSPTVEEYEIAKRVMRKKDDARSLRWYVQGNAGWFVRFKDELAKVIRSGNAAEIDEWAIPFISTVFDKAQPEIIEMVKPLLTVGPDRLKGMSRLFWQVKDWKQEAIKLHEDWFKLVDATERREFYRVRSIAKSDARAACRLVRIALEKEHEAAKERKDEPLGWSFRSDLEHLNGTGIGEVMEKVAASDPATFLAEMTPWLELVLKDSLEKEDGEYFSSDPLSSGLDYGVYVVQYQILQSIRTALIELGRTDREGFLAMAARLSALAYDTPQRILTQAYTELPGEFYREAFEFLVADTRRLALGHSEVFDSRQLVKAITPLLDDAAAKDLEEAILAISQRKIVIPDDLRFRFFNQLYLLDSFDANKLSGDASKYLAELRRKYPKLQISKRPVAMQSGFVGSPIAEEVIGKMTDKAWMGAFRKYSGGAAHKESLKGGAQQLSSTLVEEVKKDPTRFYKLALRVPKDTDWFYLSAFINGFAASSATADELFEVIRRFDAMNDERIRRVASAGLQNRAADGVPDDLLEALETRLYGAPSDDEESWRKRDHTDRPYSPLKDGPFISLINSARGSAFEAVMRILDERGTEEAEGRRWSHLVSLSKTGSDALKAGVAQELLRLYDKREVECVALFEEMIEANPGILATHFGLEFIYWATPSHFGRFSKFIEMAMENAHESVQQRAGTLATLAQLYSQINSDKDLSIRAKELAEKAETDKRPAPRRGAAEVYVSSIKADVVAELCAGKLVVMLDDSDEKVREMVSRVFSLAAAENIVLPKALVEKYVEARMSIQTERDFEEYLWKAGLEDPEWSLDVVERFVELNPPTNEYRNGEYFIRLVLRIHVDPLISKQTRVRALDVFDLLSQRYNGSANTVLSEWDRN